MGGRGGSGPTLKEQVTTRRESNNLVDTEGVLVKSLRKLARGKAPGSWTDLATVRESLPSVEHARFDDAVRGLMKTGRISIVPEEDQKTLTPRRRNAAVRVGGENNHLIRLRRSDE